MSVASILGILFYIPAVISLSCARESPGVFLFFKQQREIISFRIRFVHFVEVHGLSTRGQQSKAKHLLLCCPCWSFLFVPFTRAEQFILNKTHHLIAPFTKNSCFLIFLLKFDVTQKTLEAIR